MEDCDSLGARQQPYDEKKRVQIGIDFKGDDVFEDEDVYCVDDVIFKIDDLSGALRKMHKETLIELLDCFRDLEIINRCWVERYEL